MGRKGIGKLAPFGICKRIEVLSAGGKKTSKGYLVTHFYMDYDNVLSDTDKEVPLERGKIDRSYAPNKGTLIRLSDFHPEGSPFLRKRFTAKSLFGSSLPALIFRYS